MLLVLVAVIDAVVVVVDNVGFVVGDVFVIVTVVGEGSVGIIMATGRKRQYRRI